MFAVVYIPDFSLQAVLRHRAEWIKSPLALLSEPAANAAIIQMTPLARASGIHEGMTATQALARCPQIVIQARSAQAEAATQEALLQCVFGFSPFVESTANGVCTLDLRGLPVARNGFEFSDELQGWGQTMIASATRIHLRGQIGIARTPDLATLAARFAEPFLMVENAAEFVSALPIESLEPSPPLHAILQSWGIATLGALSRLGKEAVTERLGVEGLLLFKRVSSDEVRPLKLAVIPEVFAEGLDLEMEVETLEPLLFILRRFVEQLSRRLELVYLVASELKLTLTLASSVTCERLFAIPSPTRNVETLFRILFTHLENFKTESPVMALRLEAVAAPAENHQFALFEISLRDPNHFFETVARLGALLGTGRIGTPLLQASYRADDFKMEPVKFKELEEERISKRHSRKTTAERPVSRIPTHGLALRRFRPPIPAEVQMENQRPARLESSQVRGRITQASGPWRTSGNWWENHWERDEWDIATASGRLCRIYHEATLWFLEGIFD